LYLTSEFLEVGSLDRFCEVVRQDVVCWTVFDRNFSRLDAVFDEELPNVDVIGPFTARLFSVCFQQHGANVALVQY
jgi:hypothetical protein